MGAFCQMSKQANKSIQTDLGFPVLPSMSRVMQYHGCRSNIKDRSKVTELEDKFDLLVDTKDVILERVVSISPHS